MTVRLNPYLHFRDDARQAMEFYSSVFGGKLTLSTFGESMSEDPADQDKVMHAMLESPDGMVLMGGDAPAGMAQTPAAGVSICLNGDDEAQLRGYWEALSAGAAIGVPLEQSPWGDVFGMCTDTFGTEWLVNISPAGVEQRDS